MKQDPPTFRVTYNDTGASLDQKGFKAFRNEAGEWINSRTVILQFFPWSGGAYLMMTIEEEYSHPDVRSGLVQNRRLDTQVVYDRPNALNEFMIIPSLTQAYQFMAILNGGFRGEWANNMVNDLYHDIFVMNPKSILGKYLPDVKTRFEETIERFNMDWAQESK